MAFECQESTKIALIENSADKIDNSGKEVVDLNFSSNQKKKLEHHTFVKKVNTEIEGECEKPISMLEYNSEQGIGTSYFAKQALINGVLSNSSRSITDLPPALVSEILNCLDPKDLGIVSCVSTSLYWLAAEHNVWKEFYCERWELPAVTIPPGSEFTDQKSWKELFIEKEFQSKKFLGRYSIDALYGHTEAVRTVFALNSKKLVFTSGYDAIVRMWDMEEGLLISSSRPLGCTIRAVAADTKLLIAGGTDGFVHGWRAEAGHPHLFDISGPQNQNKEFRLWEHEGPISCLDLDLTRFYSGSWDMSIRVWDRSTLKCVTTLRHNDWVWSLFPHSTTVVSTSGSDLYVWDTNSGSQVTMISDVHVGNAYALARSHTGNFIFTGGEDGAIRMFEINNLVVSSIQQIAKWIPHAGSVYSLAFEFPWLVSASSDGKLALIDVRKLLKTSRKSSVKNLAKVNNMEKRIVEPPQRMLHGFGCNLFSVDIGSHRIVCGGEEGVVRIWNFSQALEIEHRVRALKGIRLENRMRRHKLQTEINNKGVWTGHCSVAAKKIQINGDRNGVFIKRRVSGKLKA